MPSNGLDFEYRVQTLFADLGYPIFETPMSHDYGGDLVLYFDGKSIVIQCKDSSKTVGVSAVQEAVAAIAYYKVDQAAVFTSSSFTPPARKLARANDVVLVDGRMLETMEEDETGELAMFVQQFQKNNQEPVPVALLQKDSIITKAKRFLCGIGAKKEGVA